MAEKLSKKEVEKIAELARLDLTEKEVAVYAEQLSAILEYVDQLQEVDTKNIEITSQTAGLSNVMREDEVKEYSDPAELIEMSPEHQDNLIKVKAVFSAKG